MSPLVDFLFGQYSTYAPLDIAIEITAVLLGLASVWYAKQNKVAVYPTGMISTALFVYLLLKWGLIGDMLINAYYFIISIYGWYFWIQKREGETLHPISRIKRREVALSVLLFLLSLGFVYTIYQLFALWNGWTAYVDTFTTAIFFVGMWLMARRKIEHWLFWIVGDIISVPLYFHKGLTLTSLQYIIFTLIAFYGYRSWKKALN
jgi:nicotinamide mononucleotide transporter